MKRNLLLIFFTAILLFSCRGDDETVQNIDQVLNIYVKNSDGKDLLNSETQGSYNSVQFLDLLANVDLKPVSTSLLKDQNNISYIDYASGAVRLIQDSISPENKTYYSSMIMRFTKIENSQTITVDDNIKIEYSWTPSRFQVNKMWHSGQLVFTKVTGQPNIVNIVK